jgi:hypothetical protein
LVSSSKVTFLSPVSVAVEMIFAKDFNLTLGVVPQHAPRKRVAL